MVDGYVGWVPEHQLKVRVICARAYHALFISNMMVRPTDEQLLDFGEPDFIIYNAGQFPANRYTEYVAMHVSRTTRTNADFASSFWRHLGEWHRPPACA